MELNLEPVKVDIQIENPSLERGAFYSLCFITENDLAPRTLEVRILSDLLENGYSRLDLAYNFCVGVFSQQGMDTVYIRAKRSSESYVEAYNSDNNSMYYFVVLQTKYLSEVEKFNSHLVSSDEMKLQFFSQNVGSKILQSPKMVNYYQDYTFSDGVSVESKDYYLNKAYGGSVNAEDMGLKSNYSGTGWYKATDTGTVFNKGVPALETHVFSDSPKEYVSVYTQEDAKLYGERAATSNLTNMYNMFGDTPSFSSDISSWDVSSVTDMGYMFGDTTSFNSDISSWDVSKVTDMTGMFYNTTEFNQDLSKWCVTLIPTPPSNFDYLATAWTLPKPVWGTCPSKNEEATIPSNEMHFTTLAGSADYVGTQGDQILLSDGTIVDVTSADETTTFVAPAGRHKVKLVESADRSNFVSVGGGALVELHNFPTLSTVTSFNFSTHEYNDAPNLTKVPEVFPSNIINIEDLFNTTENFNQDISMWDVSNVKIFDYVFSYTPLFNHPLNSWDVSGATSMYALFVGAPLFDQPLDNWDVSNVTNMSRMFDGATAFNQDISMWNTSNVTNMRNMFNEAIAFNQPLDNWNTSNVTDMSYMFFNATSFNQDISSWDVSNVTDMEIMFYDAAAFNQDISSWNVSKVENMQRMFQNATSFNQDLSQWCVGLIAELQSGFDTNTPSWTLPKPVWGTCPRGELG